MSLRISFLILHFLFSYFKYIFAFLQMYIASIAATATTAIEIIVNVIIFSFLKFLNLKCYPNLFFYSPTLWGFCYPFDDAKVRPFLIGCIFFIPFSKEKATKFDDNQYFDIGQGYFLMSFFCKEKIFNFFVP